MENDINLHILFVTAFIRKGDEYLFAQRSLKDKQAAGTWATPGGKVDNEIDFGIVENTVIREIREEVGVEVDKNLHYLGSDAFIRSSGHHVVALVFLANYKSGDPKPLEDQEAVKWMKIEEIEELANQNESMDYLKNRLKLLKDFVINNHI